MNPSSRRTDILITGAGPAGVAAALSARRTGRTVMLIDAKSRERIGDKVCGDGMSLQYVRFAAEKLGVELLGEEIDAQVSEAVFEVGDVKASISDSLVILKRKEFGQRLLKICEREGVEVLCGHSATSPLVIDGAVRGALVRPAGTNTAFRVYAAVTIDCTGKNALLRRRLPPGEFPLVESAAPSAANALCYREIIDAGDSAYREPHAVRIVYDDRIPRPGYFWLFPKGGRLLNAGISCPLYSPKSPHEILKVFHAILEKYVDARLITRVEGKWDLLPSRAPCTNCVANGFIVAGDAAYHASPFTGEGHGPALIAGYWAGIGAARAVETGACTADALWNVNGSMMKEICSLHLSDTLLAGLIRSISFPDLARLVGSGILNFAILGMTSRDPAAFMRMVSGILRIASRPKLAAACGALLAGYWSLDKLTRQYPADPEGYGVWKNQLDNTMARFCRRVNIDCSVIWGRARQQQDIAHEFPLESAI